MEERYTYMVKNVAHIIEHYKLCSDAWNCKKLHSISSVHRKNSIEGRRRKVTHSFLFPRRSVSRMRFSN